MIELRSPDVVLRDEIFVLADSSVGDALNEVRELGTQLGLPASMVWRTMRASAV